MKIYESHLDLLGKIPGIQQVSGVVRIGCGIYNLLQYYKIQHITKNSSPDPQTESLKERGKLYIGRGITELIPVISTIVWGIYDSLAYLLPYTLDVEINNPHSEFIYEVTILKCHSVPRLLFNVFEKGVFFEFIDREEGKSYAEPV